MELPDEWVIVGVSFQAFSIFRRAGHLGMTNEAIPSTSVICNAQSTTLQNAPGLWF